jgi:hypothetical protein
MHKANAVLTFIENPDRIKDLRSEEDRDIDAFSHNFLNGKPLNVYCCILV